MSELEWRNDKVPVSKHFDDPYYSVDDGRAETDYVFIQGNKLPSRWIEMENYTIAELGFGTGLNFLETVRQWEIHKAPSAKLHFISFEQFPISKEEIAKALSNWPELNDLASKLISQWRTDTEMLSVAFNKNIQLTVHVADANTILPDLNFEADAWYLDGFSPAKNPELWNEKLMQEVGTHTKRNGTFATYTAAGFVKRGLERAGFHVKKTKGFGRKRDMLTGEKTS